MPAHFHFHIHNLRPEAVAGLSSTQPQPAAAVTTLPLAAGGVVVGGDNSRCYLAERNQGSSVRRKDWAACRRSSSGRDRPRRDQSRDRLPKVRRRGSGRSGWRGLWWLRYLRD